MSEPQGRKSGRRPLGLVLLLLATALARCNAADPGAKLHDLIDREWRFRLAEDPLFATSVGVHEYDDRLPSVRPADLQRRAETWRGMLAEIDAIDRSALTAEDDINLQILRRQLAIRVADFDFGAWQMPINADSGFHMDFSFLAEEMPLRTVGDYENYIARLRAFPEYVNEQIENMRTGLSRGMTVPRVTLQGYEATISPHVVERVEQSVFYEPFTRFPASVPEGERERLREEGRSAILDGAVAGYRAFGEFMTAQYIPQARTTLGASELPDGRAYYDHLVRRYTTLDLDAEQVHEQGLREVQRIQAEMLAILHEVGFEGGLRQFIEFLRTDPQFYAKTPEELLMRAAYLCKRMDAKLPALFKTLPRLPYGVAAVPEHIAPKYTAGRYVPPPEGSTQPGYYWVNTYALDSRPLYALPALTLHEAVPGHHLQGALSSEREDLPNFRRYSYISAFGEGWGLYSEWLGIEAGIYTDPYTNFGRLTYEMWRACRLVVDTGVHAMGWTREQMIDYLASHTALSLHEVQTETDRYISWPGQALAYKIGEMKIKELRRRAEQRLGDRFDVREFHDVVLLNGSVPLPVLEDQVERYIAQHESQE